MAILAAQGPAGIDLSGLRADAVSPIHLAVALRATFALRAEVEGWDEAILVAIDACALRGLDARDALFGML